MAEATRSIPMIASTWSFAERCNESGWPALAAGGVALVVRAVKNRLARG